MNIPEYITKAEVQRICQELGIQDWSKLTQPSISLEDARTIQGIVGGEALSISTEAYKQALEVELEHGILFPDANVTNNHPVLTGRIVLAHLKETLDYYARLQVAESEGDLLKAFQAGDAEKLVRKYQQLLNAKAELAAHEKAAIAKK
jgi:hypothetical protein